MNGPKFAGRGVPRGGSAFVAALVASALVVSGFSAPAAASPIQYTLTFDTSFLNPTNNIQFEMTATIGADSYTGKTVRLTFTGDDQNVHSGVSPLNFSEIHEGFATVTVLDGSQVLKTATFLPNQVAVTADHPNNGFGFGFIPGGVGAGGFDPSVLQAVYPAAISPTFVGDPYPDPAYDLTLAYAQAHVADSGTGFAYTADGSADLTAGLWSCYDFQGRFGQGCATPQPMPTDQGDFSISGGLQPWYAIFRGGPLPVGVFTARPLGTVPEPASLALLAVAFVAMAWARRRNLN